jgi:signal transduction histidine kinase
VINLIDNAIKFTPAFGQVEIGVARRDGHAVLRFADSGPGIPPADLQLSSIASFAARRAMNLATASG